LIDRSSKQKMHPRNRFRDGYDFARLVGKSPRLGPFVRPNEYGDDSIDYADPAAVKALNQALLADAYGIRHWDIPNGYLCPPVPGRSDYIHHLADLLGFDPAASKDARPPIHVLDIGVGANCIYPIIGASEYGWRFVGTDIDRGAIDAARWNASANPKIARLIECRLQDSPRDIFKGVIRRGEFFDLSLSNPPYYASADEAAAANLRKRRNLGGVGGRTAVSQEDRNFGGRPAELWCSGGELGFALRMIEESREVGSRVGWFTTVISRSENLRRLRQALDEVGAPEVRVIEMGQGQKQSRILAWRFGGTVPEPDGAPRAQGFNETRTITRLKKPAKTSGETNASTAASASRGWKKKYR
jgi:23S rRNA (adenine1618-N6)-methyltransferase